MNLTQTTIRSTTVGRNPLEENGVAIIVNRRVQNVVLGWNLKKKKKQQNDMCSFPRQTTQYHGNPSLCPKQQH